MWLTVVPFVPPVGAQISVSGAVKRPAIYEVRSGTSIAELTRIAGGFRADAYPGGARIERIDAGQERVIVDIDANGDEASATTAQPGDVLIIPQVLPELEESVTLIGHVDRPGPSQPLTERAHLRLHCGSAGRQRSGVPAMATR